MTVPGISAAPAGPLRHFEEQKVGPVPPEDLDWSSLGNHLRSTYEALYIHDAAIKSLRTLASIIGRSSSTADRHARVLESHGLLRIEEGVGGLADECRPSTFHLVRRPLPPVGGMTGHRAEASTASSSSPTGTDPDPLLLLLTEVVARYAPGPDAEVPAPFRADEERWQRNRHAESGRLIALAWLEHGRPEFTAPQMAEWTGLDRKTVYRRLTSIKDDPSDGVSASYNATTRRWIIQVAFAVTSQQWDAVVGAVMTERTPEVSLLLEHIVVGDPMDRSYTAERKAHRNLSRDAYAARMGNATDWIAPPKPGRRWRGVRPFGLVEHTVVDVAGWPQVVLVPEPHLTWEDPAVEVVGPGGGVLRGTVPRALVGAPPPAVMPTDRTVGPISGGHPHRSAA